MNANTPLWIGQVVARRPGEGQNIVTNLVIGLLAALVAYGRFVVAPL